MDFISRMAIWTIVRLYINGHKPATNSRWKYEEFAQLTSKATKFFFCFFVDGQVITKNPGKSGHERDPPRESKKMGKIKTFCRREGEADGYDCWRRVLMEETASSNFCFFPSCLCNSSTCCVRQSSEDEDAISPSSSDLLLMNSLRRKQRWLQPIRGGSMRSFEGFFLGQQVTRRRYREGSCSSKLVGYLS